MEKGAFLLSIPSFPLQGSSFFGDNLKFIVNGL
jgi:hypothetical protein